MPTDRRLTKDQIESVKNTERSDKQRSRTWITWGDGLYSLSFDAIVEAGVNRVAEISRFPVEDGFIYTDHILANPLTVRIRAHVSDQPIYIPGDNLAEGVTGSFQDSEAFKTYMANHPEQRPTASLPSGRLIRNTVRYTKGRKEITPNVLVFEGGALKRVVNIFDQLNTFLETGELLSINTRFDRFDDMAVKMLEAESANRGGDGAFFRLDFQQVKVVESASVSGGARKKPKRKKDVEEENAGGDTQTVNPRNSIAYTVRDQLEGYGVPTDVVDKLLGIKEGSSEGLPLSN